jgi:hypothetical protein
MHDKPPRDLIPQPLQRAHMLFWTGILPQLVLLALNVRSYGLASGEMSAEQLHRAWALGAMLGTLLLLNMALGISFRLRGGVLPWAWNFVVLIAHAAYLWCATPWIGGQIIPASAASWILPPERVLYHQYALIMPAVFYAALRLSCFPARAGQGKDLLITGGVAVLIPAGWYVIVHVIDRMTGSWSGVEVLFFLMLAVSTVIAVGALLRLLIVLCNAIRSAGSGGMMALTAVVALACPLLGLALNIKIPFPADFQGVGVYVMAVLNGALLLLPAAGGTWGRALWAAQCALFAFTAYFFVVFLPFLPLSIVAIIAMGSGLLMLTPTALFALHTWRLIDGYRRLWKETLPGIGILVGAGAFLLLPAGFTVRALVHRQVLLGAIAHVLTPDYREARYDGRRGLLRVTLENLRDFKDGLDLPFLTELYSGIVFNGLVLPDEKMDQIHRAFFGRDLERNERSRMFSPFFGTRRDVFRLSRRTVGTPPPTKSVVLGETSVEETVDGDAARALVTLTMTNGAENRAEFAARMTVPAGVQVSGFWLYIDGKREPGRLFEKKTALWVYRMIRDVERRDPATLVYTAPGELELRVFPFAAHETRKVEIEFLRPAGWAATVGVNSMPIELKGETGGGFLVEEGGHTQILLSGQRVGGLPAWERKPYLHFIVERAAQSTRTAAENLKRCAEIARRFTGFDGAMVTFANFEQLDLTGTPAQPDTFVSGDLVKPAEEFPKRGGFCRDRAIKACLLACERRLSDPAQREVWQDRCPVFVVVRDGAGPVLTEDGMAGFASIAPDIDRIYTVESDGSLRAAMFGGEALSEADTALRPLAVALLSVGPAVAVIRLDDQAQVLLPSAGEPVALGPGGADRNLAGDLQKLTHASFASGVRVAALSAEAIRNPARGESLLPEIVALSRESGILAPATCYIVVENSAQWRILEAKEKQKLGASAALEFMESPEPGTWVLLFGLAGWLILRRRWRRFARAV